MSPQIWITRLDQTNPDAQMVALRELAAQDRVEGLAAACLNCLASSDSGVRTWAAEALGTSIQMSESELSTVAPYLEPDLESEFAPDQAYWAATLLGRFADPAVAPSLVDLATAHDDKRLDAARDRAIKSLSRVDARPSDCLSAEQIDRLRHLIRSEPNTRRAVIAAQWLAL